MDTKLYEDMMLNAGKKKNEIWGDVASKFVNDTFAKDVAVYGKDTKGLYECIFSDEADLFESVQDKLLSLNEEEMDAAGGIANFHPKGNIHTSNRVPGNAGIPSDAFARSGSFLGKLKGLFAGAGEFFKKGIAGAIANPIALVASGIGVGAVIALIAKFKKLSDAKKEKALAALDKKDQKKVELVLAKDSSELKKELEKKAEKK